MELRVGECNLLTDPAQIRVVNSPRNARTVPIPPEAADRIQRFLATRKERGLAVGPTAPLLVQADGRPMSRSAIDHAVRRWFQRSGRTPPPGALAHSLRHTYAAMLIESGARLADVQALLGHADIAATQAYDSAIHDSVADAAMSNPARKLLA